jgi:L-fuculose-phosphate aldolase
VREGDAFWITPTGCCADTLSSGELIECRLDGLIGTGASMDARLHLAVYQVNPDSRAVLQ